MTYRHMGKMTHVNSSDKFMSFYPSNLGKMTFHFAHTMSQYAILLRVSFYPYDGCVESVNGQESRPSSNENIFVLCES